MDHKQLIKMIIFELDAAGLSLYDIGKVLNLKPSETYKMYLELMIELEPAPNNLIN